MFSLTHHALMPFYKRKITLNVGNFIIFITGKFVDFIYEYVLQLESFVYTIILFFSKCLYYEPHSLSRCDHISGNNKLLTCGACIVCTAGLKEKVPISELIKLKHVQ